ncbi:MAG: phosphodiester glycosidase family protein [Bacilli bacterium]|nr:phosphodiester glycosidase family protein [Bacilli bacterium]MDD3304963.1 phosphodiester glycosidase family protein [Bacilli bacterium]MDD4054076.1 phosphodiester glycosidase family protein [Bacilli bacterium]MDD4411404.1 phosphodiester glycosidase family protein [Bacilli bacterium]
MSSRKRKNTLIVGGIILDLFICIALIVLYGPWSGFRTFWITTAMSTMNHQYLAYWFYSNETIQEVLENNYIIESNNATDISLIKKIAYNKNGIYEDKYEEQILNKDKGNNSYKVINVKGSGYKGYLIAVYDPSKVELVMTRYLKTKGENILNLAKNNDARVAINASGFVDPNEVGNGGMPTGSVIKDNKLIFSSPAPGRSGGVIGFDKNDNLILSKENISKARTKYKLRDAVEFGPFLIVNGKASFIKGDGGWGVAPRTVIGQRRDGIVLFLIIDGRKPGYSNGATMSQLTEIMMNYKAVNASNLDGGASTALVVENEVRNKPAGIGGNGLRRLPNAWIVTN